MEKVVSFDEIQFVISSFYGSYFHILSKTSSLVLKLFPFLIIQSIGIWAGALLGEGLLGAPEALGSISSLACSVLLL